MPLFMTNILQEHLPVHPVDQVVHCQHPDHHLVLIFVAIAAAAAAALVVVGGGGGGGGSCRLGSCCR